MLYRQKFDVFIRVYEDVGYIVNAGNFNDRVVDASGSVFLAALSRSPKTLDEIAMEVTKNFVDADVEEIKNDAHAFYSILEQGGFIVSGETETELNGKDKRFSYADVPGDSIKNEYRQEIIPGIEKKKDSRQYLEEHFKSNPHLMDLEIELTSRCNERCIHCYIPHENKNTDIEPELFYKVLDQCRDIGVLSLTLSGGECMLHPHFCDFLRKAKEYDFSVSILTNLTLLTDEVIAAMKETRLAAVQVSLYSMNPEIHDSITTMKGSFYKTRDAILKLIENDIPLKISCPTMKQNKHCYGEVIKWAHEHKCRANTDFIMMARYDHSIDNLDNRLSVDEAGEVIRDIIDNDEIFQEKVLETPIEPPRSHDISEEVICGVCSRELCMVTNGDIYPCSGWQDYVLGNVEKKTLKEIWKNSPKARYLRGLRRKDFPKCLSCADVDFCNLCMVRNANENSDGDPLIINEHFCKVAALNHKIMAEWKDQHSQKQAEGVQ